LESVVDNCLLQRGRHAIEVKRVFWPLGHYVARYEIYSGLIKAKVSGDYLVIERTSVHLGFYRPLYLVVTGLVLQTTDPKPKKETKAALQASDVHQSSPLGLDLTETFPIKLRT